MTRHATHDVDFPTDDRPNHDRGAPAEDLVSRSGRDLPASEKSAWHEEDWGPTGRYRSTETVGDPEETAPDEPGPLSGPGSEGTGPVDPATNPSTGSDRG